MDLESLEGTITDPKSLLEDALPLSGTTNDLIQNQFMGNDEGNQLGDGVDGYKTTGESNSNDDTALHIEEKSVDALEETLDKADPISTSSSMMP